MKHSRERSHCRSRKLLTAHKVAQVDSLRDVLHQRQSNRVIAEDADLYIFKENMLLETLRSVEQMLAFSSEWWLYTCIKALSWNLHADSVHSSDAFQPEG